MSGGAARLRCLFSPPRAVAAQARERDGGGATRQPRAFCRRTGSAGDGREEEEEAAAAGAGTNSTGRAVDTPPPALASDTVARAASGTCAAAGRGRGVERPRRVVAGVQEGGGGWWPAASGRDDGGERSVGGRAARLGLRQHGEGEVGVAHSSADPGTHTSGKAARRARETEEGEGKERVLGGARGRSRGHKSRRAVDCRRLTAQRARAGGQATAGEQDSTDPRAHPLRAQFCRAWPAAGPAGGWVSFKWCLAVRGSRRPGE